MYGLKVGKGGYYYNRLHPICFSAHDDECFSFEIPTVVNAEYFNAIVNPEDPVPNDNYYDRLLFHSSSGYPNDHVCLSPGEMNFYYEAMNDLISAGLKVLVIWTSFKLKSGIMSSLVRIL